MNKFAAFKKKLRKIASMMLATSTDYFEEEGTSLIIFREGTPNGDPIEKQKAKEAETDPRLVKNTEEFHGVEFKWCEKEAGI